MADNLDGLDPEIAQFFQTGELTGSLAQEAPVVTPVETPQIDPPQVPVQQQVTQPVTELQEDPNLVMLRTQMDQLKQYSGNLENYIRQLQQAGIQQQQKTPDAPDPETDPLGYVMHELAETKKLITMQNVQMQQQREMQTHMGTLNSFVQTARSQGEAFRNATPDFDQAYQYIRNVRTQDLRDMGLSDPQIKEAMIREELHIAAKALDTGQNPAQMIYNIAKRYGYHPQQTQTPEQKLTSLQKAADAGTARIQPASTQTDLSVEAVRGMASDQLDKLVEADDLWHKVVGGVSGGNSIFH